MQVVGVLLILSGVGLLGWFVATQRTPPRHGRRRVRFDRALELTAPATIPDNGGPFVLAPDDRDVLRRISGVFWLVVVIAVAALALAGGLWAFGRVVFQAIENYFTSA